MRGLGHKPLWFVTSDARPFKILPGAYVGHSLESRESTCIMLRIITLYHNEMRGGGVDPAPPILDSFPPLLSNNLMMSSMWCHKNLTSSLLAVRVHVGSSYRIDSTIHAFHCGDNVYINLLHPVSISNRMATVRPEIVTICGLIWRVETHPMEQITCAIGTHLVKICKQSLALDVCVWVHLIY